VTDRPEDDERQPGEGDREEDHLARLARSGVVGGPDGELVSSRDVWYATPLDTDGARIVVRSHEEGLVAAAELSQDTAKRGS
jgi:hypothetical protein